ncbi:cation:proton antiporter [Oceanobacter sp. 3_MG-2023]|uniref:cation:proton antiporter n=1 Tax=Oceanobacter sp. 3_MG-2023 TaxID=3062622 RepID=UPI0027331A52|nr:cation:proton antiporter [Oceanobacter sp. 3_MG-2023]MDP2504316.1 cation:proton antiporter [Oceanobacter sp. 3_MG-2023]
MQQDIVFSTFLIFAGASILATFALYTRQPVLIAYIALGTLIGPFGVGWIDHPEQLENMSHIGIIFLLFLLGLDMQPSSLIAVIKQASTIGLASSLVFFLAGFSITWLFGFSQMDSIIIGLALMFSSTIIGLKLLPTTVLHHKHMGNLMIGLLLLQDMLAIFTLIFLGVMKGDSEMPVWQPFIALPLLIGVAYLAVRFVLLPLITRFDRYREYLFILAIGWCLSLAEAAQLASLTYEIGAFIAGITLATSPIAQFIAISLKPLRDFFLVMFFFALGAGLDLTMLPSVAVSAITLAVVVLALKPITFRVLLRGFSERTSLAWDVGFRLGQISEFSLLVAFVAVESSLLSERGSLLIQATAIITFVISSYIVVFNYPNPIAVSDKLRRD